MGQYLLVHKDIYGMEQAACQMLGNRTIGAFIALLLHTSMFDIYLYELLWGNMNISIVKGIYYFITAIFLLYITINDIAGYTSEAHLEISHVSKFSIIINFMFFALTLFNILQKPILYLFLFNGGIFAVSMIILLSGVKHGIFKN